MRDRYPTPDDDRAHAFTALIASDRGAREEAREAIELSGGVLLADVHWDAVNETLSGIAQLAVIVAEVDGMASDRLGEWLDALARHAADFDAAIILSLGEAQLDMAGALIGRGNIVLCMPTVADRVAAIAAAVGQRKFAVADTIAEDEAARLARLNAEVARIAETLARLTQREPRPARHAAINDRLAPFGIEPVASDEPVTAPEVRRAIRARRTRDELFGQALFEDPAWDMMLDLYAAHLERAHVSVSSLCIAAAVASTTALRWIGRMVDAGLFVREPDPFDRRRVFMALSPSALDGMRRYARGLREAGLTMA